LLISKSTSMKTLSTHCNLFTHLAQKTHASVSLHQQPTPPLQTYTPVVQWIRHDGARRNRLSGKVRDLSTAVEVLIHTGVSPASSAVEGGNGIEEVQDVDAIEVSDSLLRTRRKGDGVKKRGSANARDALVSPKRVPLKKLRRSATRKVSYTESSVEWEGVGRTSRQKSHQPHQNHSEQQLQREDTQLQVNQEVQHEDPFVAAAYALLSITQEPAPSTPTSQAPIIPELKSPSPFSRNRRSSTPSLAGAPRSFNTRRKSRGTTPSNHTNADASLFLTSPPVSEDRANHHAGAKFGMNLRNSVTTTPTKPPPFLRSNSSVPVQDLIVLPEIDDNDAFYSSSEEKPVQKRKRGNDAALSCKKKVCERQKDPRFVPPIVWEEDDEEEDGEECTDIETEDEASLEVSKLLCDIRGGV
ncbi:hypothetical protein HDU98_011747, partial [Podochytrium sp. JEL0797]